MERPIATRVFSRANPQKLFLPIIIDPEYHYEAINVEAQQNNPSSLLWWTKRLIAQRRLHQAFGRGSIEFLHPENRRILAFIREFGDERLLVVANLSRFVQYVELDLAKYAGVVPVELFGGTAFPRVGPLPYLLTLSPHSIYWFSISPEKSEAAAPAPSDLAEIWTNRDWELLFENSGQRLLESSLRKHFNRAEVTGPWRVLRALRLRDSFRIPCGDVAARLAIVELEFDRGTPETRVVALAFASQEEAAAWPQGSEPTAMVRLSGPKSQACCTMPSTCRRFAEAMLNTIAGNVTLVGSAEK